MQELSTRYNPQAVEEKWYQHWSAKKYFRSVPDEREPFTILIPPPNVTGFLHMGHMLNNTIQDILIRKARLDGKNACWVPGTDHASIATEAKVVDLLRKQGIKKSDLSREEFLKHAWAWKEKYGDIILTQLQKLGASCDWERTRFTMEPSLSKAVTKVFVDLYNKKRIYRGLRLTNWDCEALTVLSNEEVIYSEEPSKLYHLRYQIEGEPNEWVTIATVRPETIMGDTAVAIHPNDERYKHLHGKRAIIPLINRSIPIILDSYVTMDFGTGCLKVTPAHDQDDYQLGIKHQLQVIDTFDQWGKLNANAQIYIGVDRFEARKLVTKDLEEQGHLVKTEEYVSKIGRSERTNSIIEPRLSEQWFVDMKQFAKMALQAVESGEVTFFPPHFFNMYYQWLNEDNIRDWCISRQLWWGHRIPAWYYDTPEGEKVVVAETAEEALHLANQARASNAKKLEMSDLRQDEDALDTWFSSWLWPISVFDGFENQAELQYYYPTSVLVTGWDIMFFWVARMIMAGYEWSPELLGADFVKTKGKNPFQYVYFTGMVRDQYRRKMSKSLGNSPDALELIAKYGGDGVRFGMMYSGAAGNDIIFDAPFDKQTNQIINESERCQHGLSFCNKIWNAMRLVKGWEVLDTIQNKAFATSSRLAIIWFEHRFSQMLQELESSFKEYRLAEALVSLYNFIWDDFFSWYLEMVKPPYGEPIDRATYEASISFFEKIMITLHPFMPFVTEEIWHHLRERKEGEDCIVSKYPKSAPFVQILLSNMDIAKDIISKVRDLRTKNGLKKHEPMQLFAEDSPAMRSFLSITGMKELLEKMAVLSTLEMTKEEPRNGTSFMADTHQFYLIIEKEIDVDAERTRLQEEWNYQQGFLESVNKKLENERFVQNAPAAVLENERKKQADAMMKMKLLQEQLDKLG